MKKTLVFFVFLLLVLAACSSQTTVYPEQQVQGKTTTQTAPKPTNLATDYATQLQTIQTETMSKNDITQDLVIPINNKIGKVGDTVIFGTVYNQVNREAGSYFAKIYFAQATDKNSNHIEVDKDTVTRWLRATQTEDTAIPEKGNMYIPVIVNVGDEIKAGISTVPGTYEFRVQIYHRLEGTFTEAVRNIEKPVYVRVQ